MDVFILDPYLMVSRPQVILGEKLEVNLVPLQGIHLCTLSIGCSPRFGLLSSTKFSTCISYKGHPFLQHSSLEGMIFVSLRPAFGFLAESFASLPHLHTLMFYCNSPTWSYGKPTSPCQSTYHKILEEVCLRFLG